MSITPLNEWSNLPDLPCPKIRSPREAGAEYRVAKVAFLAVPKAACAGVDVKEAWLEADRYFFPMIEIEKNGRRAMHKLPLALADWAFNTTALAREGG